jgi:glyoxylase-like metal-dependent hydrolase (beta-lactamase superfamily II)
MLTQDISLEVKRFETCAGAKIFRIPLLAFPSLWGYAYLALVDDGRSTPYRVLIDTGSGFGDSNQHLESGLQAVSSQLGHSLELADLTHILITHGHIDHFGGLTYVHSKTSAQVGVHELDQRNLTNYEERLTIVARRLKDYLSEAGLTSQQCSRLIEMYMITKMMYHSVNVDFSFEKVGMQLGPFKMFHVPGHCAGHVVIRLHDVLFGGDHILSHISPHQSPEQLTLSTGLEHYLKSLDAIQSWANGIRLTLPGHEEPIFDLFTRISEIKQVHQGRLEQVMKLLSTPHTIQEVSNTLFGEVHGYNELLALEETGAHIEFLYQRGLLGIENLEELESGIRPLPIRYRSLPSRVE